MNKPREFWIKHCDYIPDRAVNTEEEAKCGAGCTHKPTHVREVIEAPTDEQIKIACEEYTNVEAYSIIKRQENKAFEAGARWAIAKMRGGE